MATKVLVVDDETAILRLLEVNLARAGYEVSTAYDGIEGLQKVQEVEPDLIVLDIVMPNMDGYQMMNELQSHPRYKDIPVIILTALAQDADIHRGWRSGAAAYITKPIVVEHFVTMLKRVEDFMDTGSSPSLPLTGV